MEFAAVELTETFAAGSAAFISSIIVFVGSVFLLMSLVMGARLAYMITASVTLSFTLMMALVWSYGTPLGPVGDLPEWNPVDISTDLASLGFEASAEYPDGDWEVPEEGDAAASDLESSSTDYVATAIEDGTISDYEDPSLVGVVAESTRLLERGGTLYGMIALEGLEATEGEGGPPIYIVMDYDPGNPSGPARMIAAGTFVLLAGHLVLLSRMEKRSLKEKEKADA